MVATGRDEPGSSGEPSPPLPGEWHRGPPFRQTDTRPGITGTGRTRGPAMPCVRIGERGAMTTVQTQEEADPLGGSGTHRMRLG
jgi:hypothetical protein